MSFPQQLPWEHLTSKGFYTLKESKNSVYAFYEKDVGLGFKHAIEIEECCKIDGRPNKKLIGVRTITKEEIYEKITGLLNEARDTSALGRAVDKLADAIGWLADEVLLRER